MSFNNRIMIESPLLREIGEQGEARGQVRGRIEAHIEDILEILTARFTLVPQEIQVKLARIQDEPTLKTLVASVARCPNLAEFSAHLPEA